MAPLGVGSPLATDCGNAPRSPSADGVGFASVFVGVPGSATAPVLSRVAAAAPAEAVPAAFSNPRRVVRCSPPAVGSVIDRNQETYRIKLSSGSFQKYRCHPGKYRRIVD